MKPLHKILQRECDATFTVRHDIAPRFGNLWHYHDELELHFTIRGEGIRLIGNDLSPFSKGDIVLVGERLSHAWRCSNDYYRPDSPEHVEAIIVQFLPHFLGREFLELPESHDIINLFEKAKGGLIVRGRTKEKVADMLEGFVTSRGFGKIVSFLNILKALAESDELDTIVKTQTAFRPLNEMDTARINKVLDHTHIHYRRAITLEEVADLTGLAVPSFCRYFRTLTGNTYLDFLTKVRISRACQLLAENKLSTEIICYECGFNNISNFYRHFKRIMGIAPVEYRKKYVKKLMK